MLASHDRSDGRCPRLIDGRSIDADIFLVETLFQQEVIGRLVSAEVEGSSVKLVSAEDLILFKCVASRPRDLLDDQEIIFTQGELDEVLNARE